MKPVIDPALSLLRLAQARILVAGFSLAYLLARLPHFWRVGGQGPERWAPVGPLVLWSEPWPFWIYAGLLVASVLLSFLATIGWRYRWTGPLFAVALAFVLSYRNCWGMVFHTENLMVIHAGILALAPADRQLARTLRPRQQGDARWAQSLLWALIVATVLSYVVAGWAKLDIVGWEWFSGDTIRTQVAFDNLRKQALGSFYSPVGLWLAKISWVWAPLASLTFVVELCAPLALLHRKALLCWVLLAWGFHFGIVVAMGIVFPYQLSLVAYCGCLPILPWLAKRAQNEPLASPSVRT